MSVSRPSPLFDEYPISGTLPSFESPHGCKQTVPLHNNAEPFSAFPEVPDTDTAPLRGSKPVRSAWPLRDTIPRRAHTQHSHLALFLPRDTVWHSARCCPA